MLHANQFQKKSGSLIFLPDVDSELVNGREAGTVVVGWLRQLCGLLECKND